MGIVHYDVKMLNFLVDFRDFPSPLFSLPWGRYRMPRIDGRCCTLELSDFGTAERKCSGEIDLGQVRVGGKCEE